MVYRKVSFKNFLVPLARIPAQNAFQYCCLHYLPKRLSEVMCQGTTAILCIEKLKIEPAVAYITELSPILHAASDAYLTACFFSPAISLICLFCAVPCFSKRHHHVVQSLPETSLSHCSHQITKFTPFMKSVFSYLAVEAFRCTHTKTNHI